MKRNADDELSETRRIEAYLGDTEARKALGPDRPARFDPFVSFVNNWYEYDLRQGLLSAAVINAHVRKLGHPIPAALREWCRLIGSVTFSEGQNGLCDLESLEVLQRDYGMAVYCENQGNWEYFIRTEDFDQPDPLVWLNFREVVPTTCPLSSCLLAGVIHETVYTSEIDTPPLFNEFRDGVPALARAELTAAQAKPLFRELSPIVRSLSPWRPDIAEIMDTGVLEFKASSDGCVLVMSENPVGKLEYAVAVALREDLLPKA
jgi:hypothetical protein